MAEWITLVCSLIVIVASCFTIYFSRQTIKRSKKSMCASRESFLATAAKWDVIADDLRYDERSRGEAMVFAASARERATKIRGCS